MPLWLFFSGFLSGTQFSLHNHPWVLIGGYAFFYHALLLVRSSLKASLGYAFMFGYGFFNYSHCWVSHPLTAFGDMYASLQPVVFIVVPFIGALFFLIIGVTNYLTLKDGGGRRVFTLSLVTVCMEYFRCECAPSVPIGQVGSVWITFPTVAQGAAVCGLYGLSFLTLLLSYSIGAFKQSKLPLIYAACISICVVSWGTWRLSMIKLDVDERIIRIVPTSWKQTEKYKSLESRSDHLKHLVSASLSSSKTKPLLILWPETTIEFALFDVGNGYEFMYPEVKHYLRQMLSQDTTLLAGIVLRTPQNESYNSLFALNKAQDVFYIYKKRFLAPFGEFMPPFLRNITHALGIRALDDFSRGTYTQDQLVLQGGLKINPVICYEGSFTGKVLLPHQKTHLITISTNDAWFGHNGKEQQFISHAFRAVEEGVAILRCANGGFSGYISPIGTYSVSLSNQPMNLRFHKPLSIPPYRWIINHVPHWIEMLLTFGILYILISEFRHRRRSRLN